MNTPICTNLGVELFKDIRAVFEARLGPESADRLAALCVATVCEDLFRMSGDKSVQVVGLLWSDKAGLRIDLPAGSHN